jgi:peptidoglycan/xylan/chitin deacetylase (PgdA/CDA1 family)
MIITSSNNSIIPQFARSSYQKLLASVSSLTMPLLKTYADWRVGARYDETFNADERIVFTFDDFGTPSQVSRLIKVLARYQIRAVFFVQGNWAETHVELINLIAEAGHLIGDHTYSHPDLLGLRDDEVRAEIGRGVSSSWLRPPRGRYNKRIRQIAAEMGESIKYWSIDSSDWKGISADDMSRAILGQLHPAAVILFHIHADQTAEALPVLIREIEQRGYSLAKQGQPLWGQK